MCIAQKVRYTAQRREGNVQWQYINETFRIESFARYATTLGEKFHILRSHFAFGACSA